MGIFDRFKGRRDNGYVGDLAPDDGWGFVPEASASSFLAPEERRIAKQDLEDWEAMLQAAKHRDENVISVPSFGPPPDPDEEGDDGDWEALLTKAKAQGTEQPRTPAPRPVPPPPARASVPPPPSRPASFVPVPRPPRRSDDDWEAVIARAKSRTSYIAPAPVDEWTEAIKRAKGRGVA